MSYPVAGCELFTPDPAKQVGWTQKRGRQLTKCGEHPIRGTVSKSVIDALEAIEIEQKERGRPARKMGSGHQPPASSSPPPRHRADQNRRAADQSSG